MEGKESRTKRKGLWTLYVSLPSAQCSTVFCHSATHYHVLFQVYLLEYNILDYTLIAYIAC